MNSRHFGKPLSQSPHSTQQSTDSSPTSYATTRSPDIVAVAAVRSRLYDRLTTAGWQSVHDDLSRCCAVDDITLDATYLWPRPGQSPQRLTTRLWRGRRCVAEDVTELRDDSVEDAVAKLLRLQADPFAGGLEAVHASWSR